MHLIDSANNYNLMYGGPMLDFGKYKDEWGIVTALKNIVNLQFKNLRDSFILMLCNEKIMQLHRRILPKKKTNL